MADDGKVQVGGVVFLEDDGAAPVSGEGRGRPKAGPRAGRRGLEVRSWSKRGVYSFAEIIGAIKSHLRHH